MSITVAGGRGSLYMIKDLENVSKSKDFSENGCKVYFEA